VLPSRLAGDSRIVRTPTPTTARDRPPEEAAEDTSFARGLRLLLMVADRGGIRADELGSLLEMPVSTVYRYLRTLADFGFVDRHGGQYRLGPKLLIGTGANVSSERLIRHADAPLRMLAHETGETAVVVRRIGLSSICLHQIESDAPLRVTLEPGEMSPLYAGAPGRALLAFAPSEVLDEVLAQDLVRITNRTPTEPELRASLGGIVMTGTAISEGELIEGSVAMAAPVFREDGIVGAIAVIGPAFRCGEAWRARSAKLLQEAGRAINAALAEDGSQ
jgi:IclR family acetate operon transcriptional repressor